MGRVVKSGIIKASDFEKQKMSILNKKIFDLTGGNAFGLDIGELSIKAVQMDKDGGKDRVRSFCSIDLPAGTIKNGDIINPDVLISKIGQLCVNAKPKSLTTKKAICSLPESKAFLRIIKMPAMKENEMGEAIKWEIEANIPLSLDNVYYDWQVLGSGFGKESKEMTVLILAMAKETVDKFLGIMEEAGIEVVGLEIESTAQVRSLLSRREREKTNVIVDIGRHKTGFIVSYDGVPSFTSSFPIAVKSFIDAVSKSFNAPKEEVEKIVINEGVGSFTKKDPVFRATESVLENLITEIEKSIDFYLNSLQYSKSIDSILVCGGGANLKGLIPYLSKRLESEVKVGNPWANIEIKGKKIPVIDREESLQYTTAIGLALKKLRCDINCQLR